MDLSFLDQSSKVTPLLVKLYDSHKLHGLASDHKPLARAELTSAVSQLLEIDLSPKESELIADVLIALIRQAETDLKQAIAERLSIADNVPLRLILQLANDEISVAGSVLRNSPILGDMDLIYIIKSKGAAFWREVARRKSLSDHVISVLAETEDVDTAIALAKNSQITIPQNALEILAGLAKECEDLATPLLRRSEISSNIASALYNSVGEELKKFILENYEVETDTLISTVEDVVLEFVEELEESSEFVPNESVLSAADRFKKKGLLTMSLMLSTLKRGQIRAFVAQFARYTDLPPETIAAMLVQKNGQGLAITCKAFDVVKSDFASIFLLTNRVRSDDKVVDMDSMARAMMYFDTVKPDFARQIIQDSLR